MSYLLFHISFFHSEIKARLICHQKGKETCKSHHSREGCILKRLMQELGDPAFSLMLCAVLFNQNIFALTLSQCSLAAIIFLFELQNQNILLPFFCKTQQLQNVTFSLRDVKACL